MCYSRLIPPASSGHMESPCDRAWESPPPGQRAGVEDLSSTTTAPCTVCLRISRCSSPRVKSTQTDLITGISISQKVNYAVFCVVSSTNILNVLSVIINCYLGCD